MNRPIMLEPLLRSFMRIVDCMMGRKMRLERERFKLGSEELSDSRECASADVSNFAFFLPVLSPDLV